jgi:ABC-type nickel/cobalt efflux system permease component RcnA
MARELSILVTTAASLGFFHTLFGPDHYLPFIVLSKSSKWSLKKTSLITFLCGLGHILSSVVLGLIGVGLGIAVNKLVNIESVRGNVAAWLFIAFGLVYFIWGLRRAIKNKPHSHLHFHQDGSKHMHEHTHYEEHTHIHANQEKKPNLTPWILFTIFVFGPCEPLIPLLMYPAAQNSTRGLVLVTAVFGGVTIGTMMSIVLIASFGINFLPLQKIERYSHALAGFAVLACGLAIQFLGL